MTVILRGGTQRQMFGGRSFQAQIYDVFKLRWPSGRERRAFLVTFFALEKSNSHASEAVRNKKPQGESQTLRDPSTAVGMTKNNPHCTATPSLP